MKIDELNPLSTTVAFDQLSKGCGYYAISLYSMIKEKGSVEVTKRAVRIMSGSNAVVFVRALTQLKEAGYIDYQTTDHSYIAKVIK